MKKTYTNNKIDIKLQLAALWSAMMMLYIYNDFFYLFKPEAIQHIMDGNMGPLDISQFTLFLAALLMALPVIVSLVTLFFSTKISRPLNITFGVLYSLVNIANLPGEWAFYIFLGLIQLGFTVSIVWLSIKWPTKEIKSSH